VEELHAFLEQRFQAQLAELRSSMGTRPHALVPPPVRIIAVSCASVDAVEQRMTGGARDEARRRLAAQRWEGGGTARNVGGAGQMYGLRDQLELLRKVRCSAAE
jgi:hypothetical protein